MRCETPMVKWCKPLIWRTMKMEDCMFFHAAGRTVLNRTARPMESFATAQGRVWRMSVGLAVFTIM